MSQLFVCLVSLLHTLLSVINTHFIIKIENTDLKLIETLISTLQKAAKYVYSKAVIPVAGANV